MSSPWRKVGLWALPSAVYAMGHKKRATFIFRITFNWQKQTDFTVEVADELGGTRYKLSHIWLHLLLHYLNRWHVFTAHRVLILTGRRFAGNG